MAQTATHRAVWILAFMLVAAIAGATPPGIAKGVTTAKCNNEKFKECHNLVHVCPKFCPNGCYVHCRSCKPICNGTAAPPEFEVDPDSRYPPPIYPPPTASPPPPPPTTTPSPPPPESEVDPDSRHPPPTASPPPPPHPTTASPPPPEVEVDPDTRYPPPPTATPPPPPTITPSSPPPPTATPPSPTTTPLPPPPTITSPPPPTITPSSPPPAAAPPPPTTTLSSPPPSTTPPPSSPTSPVTAKCRNKHYPLCYHEKEKACPAGCPSGCEVDCVSCKPVCSCDKPGSVCQDPRFIGGDGITFYFHGKKDQDFCLVSDTNLHINGHFIGKRNQYMKRDFTWVQSIGILFSSHKLVISAQKTSSWDDSIDRLTITFDQKSIILPEIEGAKWQSKVLPKTTISRTSDTNNVVIEVDGLFQITAKVVPITEQESRVHNYGITADDCFAHLDLGFKFFSLSNEVNGILGQTYRADYVSQVNTGAAMPVMGGEKKFSSSSLLATDCSVASFKGRHGYGSEASLVNLELPSLSCESGSGGRAGVICKR